VKSAVVKLPLFEAIPESVGGAIKLNVVKSNFGTLCSVSVLVVALSTDSVAGVIIAAIGIDLARCVSV
jgi:hypothetical protein